MGDNNYYTFSDLVANLGIYVHPVTVWKWLKAMNFSLKITRPIPERLNCEDIKTKGVGTTPNPVVPNSMGGNVSMILAFNSFNIVLSEGIIHRGSFLSPCEEVFSQLRNCVRREGRVEGTEDLVGRTKSACTQESHEKMSRPNTEELHITINKYSVVCVMLFDGLINFKID
ncbi:hypothetical protein RF11_01237 [Thelohanellus kitauei]|uniref:Winged helix-turn helix domain-containing protein n=1 Tax=Thelohanellus kitauei TaxID=669202 RepID=A0A0C2IXA4_THEKT|nr:hypothetical protein RF11_01237 [Thelohanellus kitauei]